MTAGDVGARRGPSRPRHGRSRHGREPGRAFRRRGSLGRFLRGRARGHAVGATGAGATDPPAPRWPQTTDSW